MNNNTKQLIPKLRFPEFKNDGEWLSIPLINTADKKIKWSFIGGPFGSNLKVSDYTNKGIRIIQLQNIGDGFFNDNCKIYTSLEKAEELLSNNIYSGEIIISKMGDPVGRACLIPGKNERFLMASDGIRLVVDESKHSKYFIFSLLNSDIVRNKINNKATGSTRRRIGLDSLKNILLQVPSNKEEQQKIADCLTSLDNLILAQEGKVSLLQSHKKGLMQNLFLKERQTKPKFRFPEFKNEGEWEVIPFNKYITLFRGSSPRPIVQFVTREDDGINWIKIGDTKNANGFILNRTEEKITIEGAKQSRFVEKGELILANSMSYGKVYELGVKGCIYDGWFVLRNFEESFDKQYLLQLLNSDFMQAQYNKLAAGGIVKNISSEIVNITTVVRPSIKEQQKIAKCLLSLDNLIEAEINRIEELKQHKKGLMQGLFPTLKELKYGTKN